MAPHRVERLRPIVRLGLAAIYVVIGVLHLAKPGALAAIVPPVIPHPRSVVLFTGACELAGAVGLLVPWTRKLAGVMLALYALCVWPANIYEAFWHVRAPPLPDSWWFHGPRLAFQPVLIWAALFAGGVVSWPWRRAV